MFYYIFLNIAPITTCSKVAKKIRHGSGEATVAEKEEEIGSITY